MSDDVQTQIVIGDENLHVVEIPATFVNKIYLTMVPSGAKITFAERLNPAGTELVRPRVAVFLQHEDLIALHRLLDASVKNIQKVQMPTAGSNKNG